MAPDALDSATLIAAGWRQIVTHYDAGLPANTVIEGFAHVPLRPPHPGAAGLRPACLAAADTGKRCASASPCTPTTAM
jgi:hypothetical protein